jgi:MFS transporter, CP family, cyanate transporter
VPVWAGRTAALLGVLLVALTLRQAVGAVSPILDDIRVDIPLSSVGVGLLGALPPIVFAVSGFVVPLLARRTGLEVGLVLALCLMVVGHVLRAVAPNYPVLVAGTVLALVGAGFGNVVLPPTVKKYFPDRIGGVTAAYAGILSISTAIPALVAAPLSSSVGWRFSLGVWSVTAVVAMIPWLSVLARQRRESAAELAADAPPEPSARLVGRIWRSRTAVAISITFSVTALNLYAGFAWLPEILVDIAGVTQVQSGALLALFGFVGGPVALVIPLLVTRMRNAGILVFVGVGLFVVGYVGLLVLPATGTVLWVVLIGIGPLLFPLCLALINLRTRTQAGSVALSGFAQGVGYALGALGPLLVGFLHDLTVGWTAPLVFLLATVLVGIWSGLALARPRFVEDEIEAHG